MLHIQASHLSSFSNIGMDQHWNTINNTHTLTPNDKSKNTLHSNIWSHSSMHSVAKQVLSIAITIITYVPQQNECYTNNRNRKNKLIFADMGGHWAHSLNGNHTIRNNDQACDLDIEHKQWLKATTSLTIISQNNKWSPTSDVIAYCCYYLERGVSG